jgi:hypothetical protein
MYYKRGECFVENSALWIKNLARNHMKGYVLSDRSELFPLIESLLFENAVIGCGDSVTLADLGVFDFLRNGPYHFLDKFDPSLSKSDRKELYRKNFMADIFFTGVNALTLDGKLFNIDGNGSRVAPMLYGPDKVIVVAGRNKMTENLPEAIARTRNIAAPLDAKRLGKKTPCSKLGHCIDCHHQERICNDFVCIEGQFDENRIHVILLDEDLGY